jgi:hypothetical protein
LETCIHECCWEGAIISIEDHVNGGEGRERRFFVFGDLVGNDSTPEWVKCSGAKDIAPAVGIEDEIVKGELRKDLVSST